MDTHNIIVYDESREPVKINPRTRAEAVEGLGVAIDSFLDITIRPEIKQLQQQSNPFIFLRLQVPNRSVEPNAIDRITVNPLPAGVNLRESFFSATYVNIAGSIANHFIITRVFVQQLMPGFDVLHVEIQNTGTTAQIPGGDIHLMIAQL